MACGQSPPEIALSQCGRPYASLLWPEPAGNSRPHSPRSFDLPYPPLFRTSGLSTNPSRQPNLTPAHPPRQFRWWIWAKQGVSIVIVKAVARSILMKIRRDCFAELILSAAEGFVMTLGRTERPGRPKRRAV